MITGKDLIAWGFEPGPWFQSAIADANLMREDGLSDADIIGNLRFHQPPEKLGLRTNSIPIQVFIEPENELERENVARSVEAMDKLMRLPTVKSGILMPDTCPAGTIPVGGVVATENAIHPGLHSSDVCCSMAITVFNRDMDPSKVLDVAQKVTHFGPGGRSSGPKHSFEGNQFLAGLEDYAEKHFMTQGDGNHFLFVGRRRSDGKIAIVTHHGSRGLGAQLYKRGMAAAKRETRKIAQAMEPWLVADSQIGQDYWDALQIVRQWTKENHFGIHDTIAQKLGNRVIDRFWNEHNFVFQRSDGLFYHAKGATPSYAGFSPDDDGRTLIPMNMAEPILVAEHNDTIGWAPHGAGRNMSRTAYMKSISDLDQQEIFHEETKGLDIRFWLGEPDLSELPGAYKSAEQVRQQIAKHKLANVVDQIDPLGTIMAGAFPPR